MKMVLTDNHKTTTGYLVRHGLTAANRENRFAGRSDEPLHPEGVAQLELIGQRLTGLGIEAIFCGPLRRTRQSAEIVAELVGAPVVAHDGLNEIFLPHWDGLTKEEITGNFGSEYPSWLSDPADFQVQGCETILAVQQRAAACLEQLLAENRGKKILVVSHLIVIRSLILFYQQRPINEFRSIKVENGELICLTARGPVRELAFPVFSRAALL
jgi:broad specificity phosphatase PhoE